jgi:signal transduction histidine kinase
MTQPSRTTSQGYLWGAVSLGALSLLLLAVFAVYLFTRNLEMARKASRDRMTNLAAYVVEHVEKDLFSYTLILTPDNLPQGFAAEKGAWLARLAKATGLQRVAITDSSGRIYIASESGLKSGSSLLQSGDSACFERANSTQSPVFCERKQGAVALQSLYHPFDFFGTRHQVVLESDSHLLAYLEQYRAFIWAMAAFSVCVLGGLVAALFVIDRKAREALQRSRRNEQLAFLGRTSAELAHELKNPLAIIKTSADVLRKQIDPERKNQALNFLSDEVMRLSRLISNILGLSRDRELDLRAFGPRMVLEGAQAALHEIYPEVQVHTVLPENFKVRGDIDAVRQIIENLLRNAAQAMGQKGNCHVVCKSELGEGLILVADEGPGIPAEMRQTLFDPFVTGNKAGTGLGLAIVRSLAERMGWRITLLHDQAAAEAVGVEQVKTQVKTCFRLSAPLAT